jgi:hypothetical protein
MIKTILDNPEGRGSPKRGDCHSPKESHTLRAWHCGSLWDGERSDNGDSGRYFVVTHSGRHAIAVIDGIVYDHHPATPLERVKAAWRIT